MMQLLKNRISNLREEFSSSKPFNHVVIDDFLDLEFSKKLSDKFPKKDDVVWWMYDNPLEKKLAFDNIDSLDPVYRDFFDFANSEDFLVELRKLTGIENLIADSNLRGGGLHMILPGGKLDIHEDFNVHRAINSYRRVNLIFYLNESWDPEWGGALELWNKDMTACEKSVAPIHNRAVIFRTDQDSNHGHPHPLKCPENRSRISLAVYYYEPVPEGQEPEYRSTVYKRLPGEADELDYLREKRKLGRIEDKTVKSSQR